MNGGGGKIGIVGEASASDSEDELRIECGIFAALRAVSSAKRLDKEVPTVIDGAALYFTVLRGHLPELRPESMTTLHYTTVFREGDAGARAVVIIVGNVDDDNVGGIVGNAGSIVFDFWSNLQKFGGDFGRAVAQS